MKKNNDNDKILLDNIHPGLDFEQRIEILLWGDKKLGVIGIGGRIVKLERLVKWAIIVGGVTAFTLLDHLLNSEVENAGFFGTFLLKISTLLIGG